MGGNQDAEGVLLCLWQGQIRCGVAVWQGRWRINAGMKGLCWEKMSYHRASLAAKPQAIAISSEHLKEAKSYGWRNWFMRSCEMEGIAELYFIALICAWLEHAACWPFSHLRYLPFAKVFTVAPAEGSRGKRGNADWKKSTHCFVSSTWGACCITCYCGTPESQCWGTAGCWENVPGLFSSRIWVEEQNLSRNHHRSNTWQSQLAWSSDRWQSTAKVSLLKFPFDI